MDIAYDEIPERHYKESEVSELVTPGPQKVNVLHARTHTEHKGRWRIGKNKKERRTRMARTNGIVCYLSLPACFFFFAHQLAISLLRLMEIHVSVWGR